MSLILNGTDGLSDVDGTAATPAIRGTDANTGIFFGSDIIGFSEGGAEVARFNADAQFVAGAGTALLPVITTTGDVNTGIFFPAADTIAFAEGGTESMRINSSGQMLVNTSTVYNTSGLNVGFVGNVGSGISINTTTATNGATFQVYLSTGTLIGSISNNNNTGVSYNTTSDYRLKENIVPMTGALAKISQLKPVTYTWKSNGSDGEGFIAHELQAVVPNAVVGEKDAVDADGNIKPQGVDTSFLVATLTAALQELKAIVDAQAIEIAELKAK